MSGRTYSTITMTTQERDRLRREAAQAAGLNAQNRALRANNSRAEAELRRAQAAQLDLDKRTRDLSSRMEASQRAMSRQIREAVNHADESIAKERRRASEERQRMAQQFDAKLASTEQHIHSEIQEIERERQLRDKRMTEQMNTLRTQVERAENAVLSMQENNKTLIEMAQEYRSAANRIRVDVQQNFDHKKLKPHGMENLIQTLKGVNDQIELAERIPANASVACAEARRAFADAVQFRAEVILAEEEWNTQYFSTQKTLSDVQEQLEASRTIFIPIEENSTETVEVDVDNWSNGELNRLAQRISGFQKNLEQADSIQDLKGMQKAAVQAGKDITETAAFASFALLSSQERVENAEDMADKLAEYGLQVMDDSYEGEDCRAAHRIHLKNPVTGFEMVITQQPKTAENGSIVNSLETDILHFGSNSAEEGCAMAHTLQQVIGQKLENISGYESTESDRKDIANLHTFRQQQATVPQVEYNRNTQTVPAYN